MPSAIAGMKEVARTHGMMRATAEILKTGQFGTADIVLMELLDIKRTAAMRQADQHLAEKDTKHREMMRKYLIGPDLDLAEIKSLEAQQDTRGGFLLGELLLTELIDAQAEASAMRRLARSFTLAPEYESLAAPSQDSRLTSATWVSELSAGAEDAIEPFGRRAFYPRPLAKWAKVSRKLLRTGGPFAEQVVISALAEALAVPAEAAFIAGSGAGEPLGLLNTPSLSATSTAAAGQLAIADVKKWIGGLAGRHHKKATALMHVDTYNAMLQLDTAGALFQNGQLLGRYPIDFSDQFPSAGADPASLTSGTKIAVIGDFSRYWIVDSLATNVQRLREKYAATNEDGYFVRAELDAQAVDVGAFHALTVQ